MLLSGLLDTIICMNTVGFEIDDFGTSDVLLCILVDDYAVKYPVGELIAGDNAKSALTPYGAWGLRLGEECLNFRFN